MGDVLEPAPNPPPPPPLPATAVLALLAGALALRLLFLFVGPFFIRPDEVFQALEPAHRLLTGQGAVTWEWHAGIRSWLLPGVIAAIMQLSAAAGLGHSILAVQCVFATLSLAVVAAAIRFGHAFAGRTGAMLCGALTAFWPDTVLDGAHTLSETQGGNLLAIATMWAAVARRHPPMSRRTAWGIGLLAGLATILRFQLAPGVAVVLLAAMRAAGGRAPALLLAAALPVAGQAVLDTLTLGTPLQSMWKNLALNLGAHRAALYGTASPAFYLSWMVQLWGAALLPAAMCFVAGARRARLPALVAGAVIATHSLVAHKEFTFIAGAVPLILVVAAIGAASMLERRPPVRPALVVAVVAAMSLATLFSGYKPLRRDHANLPRLMREARAWPALCGLAIDAGDQNWWAWTGGASLLDRPVPLYLLHRPADLAEVTPGADALLADQAVLGDLPRAWVLDRCLQGACLLHRAGPCTPVASHLMQNEATLGIPRAPGSLRSP